MVSAVDWQLEEGADECEERRNLNSEQTFCLVSGIRLTRSTEVSFPLQINSPDLSRTPGYQVTDATASPQQEDRAENVNSPNTLLYKM